MRLLVVALVGFAVPATADVFPIQTPSGNIGCTVGIGEAPADIRCEIVERSDPPAAPRPAGCAGPWGHIFWLRERGPVQMKCGPPVGRPGGDVAQYGQTGRFGGITCVSGSQGFECRNADGHGFFLSRGRQAVF